MAELLTFVFPRFDDTAEAVETPKPKRVRASRAKPKMWVKTWQQMIVDEMGVEKLGDISKTAQARWLGSHGYTAAHTAKLVSSPYSRVHGIFFKLGLMPRRDVCTSTECQFSGSDTSECVCACNGRYHGGQGNAWPIGDDTQEVAA